MNSKRSELEYFIDKETGRKRKILVLHGYIVTPGTRSSLLTLKLLGLRFKFDKIDPTEVLHEEYLKKHPFPEEPLLEDGDRLIYEGHTIVMYLVQKYAKTDELYPKDLYKRALVNRMLHFDADTLNYRHLESFERLSIDGIDQKLLNAVYETYDMMEHFLTVNTYLAGNKMTVADLCAVTTISNMQVPSFTLMDKNKCPKLAKWFETMSQLPDFEFYNNEGSEIRNGYITHTLFALYLRAPLP